MISTYHLTLLYTILPYINRMHILYAVIAGKFLTFR